MLLYSILLSQRDCFIRSWVPNPLFNEPHFILPFIIIHYFIAIQAGLKSNVDKVSPSFTHEWIAKLHSTRKLLRLYTQNIDDLEVLSFFLLRDLFFNCTG